jgi:hypothetical protein
MLFPITVVPILIQDLIDDIPSITLALEMASDVGDVILEGADHSGAIINLRHPAWKLRVPQQGMASHELSILFCEAHSLICVVVIELILVRLRRIPFHAVLIQVSHMLMST